MVLEAQAYAYPGTFFTLTYDQRFLPAGGTLVPRHLSEFRRALRYRIGPFRYYFVGEYGERTNRPHYHGIVFGHQISREQLMEVWPYVDREKVKRFSKVGVHVGSVTVDSAAYMAGYVTKKLTNARNEWAAEKLDGRNPEFSRMSRRPGIGVPGLDAIVAWLWSEDGATYVARNADVPNVMRFGGKIFPLGRYIVERLRKEVDVDGPNWNRQCKREAREAERCVPEVAFKRELLRENTFWRAQAYRKLKRSMEKI